jgi:dolichyl-phosphate-mannose-protein mannosyltransferase
VRRPGPLALLAIVSLLSLAGRFALLGEPCHDPCRAATDHKLVFDEVYYVNAARRIAGVPVPAGMPYATAPAGVDPNAEHPQLVKLIIAGSIEVFGDGPLAWRLGSVIAGSLAILGLFALVRAAGGSPWLAVGAAALMAADNLLLVHGRIGTLDIYVVAVMLWAAVAYLRGHPILAGVLIGVGSCMKLVAPDALLVVAAIEAVRLWGGRRTGGGRAAAGSQALRLGSCAAVAAATFFALLAILDRIAPPYDPSTGKQLAGGPLAHLRHMLSFAGAQVSRHGPHGIASYPWQWFGDYKTIVYLNIVPGRPAPGLERIHPEAHFLGAISPPILLLALPGLGLALWSLRPASATGGELTGLVALAWVLGTFLPFQLASLIGDRTSYLYYMVIVMPGVYVAVARFVAHPRAPRWLVWVWVVAVAVAVVLMYPFTPLP